MALAWSRALKELSSKSALRTHGRFSIAARALSRALNAIASIIALNVEGYSTCKMASAWPRASKGMCHL